MTGMSAEYQREWVKTRRGIVRACNQCGEVREMVPGRGTCRPCTSLNNKKYDKHEKSKAKPKEKTPLNKDLYHFFIGGLK